MDFTFQCYNKLISKHQMHKRQFDNDSDFSVKKYYRRRVIRKKKLRIKGRILENQFQQTTGKWNLHETQHYVQFLKLNKGVIQDFKYRREMKIFKQMSNYIQTRTPDQCRSHHQKVQKLHKKIETIIQFYQRKVMFGLAKKGKLYSNIVLVGGQEKQEKTTCLVESRPFFNHIIEGDTISISIRAQHMAQF